MLSNLFIKSKTPSYSEEQLEILRLIRSQNVGPKTFLQLIKFFGSAKIALENIADFSLSGGRAKAIHVCSEAIARKEIEHLIKNGSFFLTYKDSKYSKLLLQIPDFPPVLSYKGNIDLLDHSKNIAIVGARNSSVNGKLFAKKIARELCEAGFVSVSGLARGIDAAVHSANTEKTIAVVAGGVDYIYPPENTKLFQEIAENGLIIAELPIGAKPLSQHFPQRNRIISGLSMATIVVEAGLKSGSLITANFALEHNREIFAVPGFPADPRCMGSNRLIKDGAYLLESSKDVISLLTSGIKMQKTLEESQSCSNNFKILTADRVFEPTALERKKVTQLLSSSPVTYETLAEDSGLDLAIIYIICLELELAGKIARYPGNRISLIML